MYKIILQYMVFHRIPTLVLLVIKYNKKYKILKRHIRSRDWLSCDAYLILSHYKPLNAYKKLIEISKI